MEKALRHESHAIYRIEIKENLGPAWKEWFGDFTVAQDGDEGSFLTGMVADQAALHGLIRKLGDLHLTLLSLIRVEVQDEGE